MFERNFRYMTPEQRRHISKLGVMAREIDRQRNAEPRSLVIPGGLQLATLNVDMRFGKAEYHWSLLFQARDYHNRYRWIQDNEKQDGLIGWHDAVRSTANLVRPISKSFIEECY